MGYLKCDTINMTPTETLNFVSMFKTIVKKAERCTNEDKKLVYEECIELLEGFLVFFAHQKEEKKDD
jgi:hypothetical protein